MNQLFKENSSSCRRSRDSVLLEREPLESLDLNAEADQSEDGEHLERIIHLSKEIDKLSKNYLEKEMENEFKYRSERKRLLRTIKQLQEQVESLRGQNRELSLSLTDILSLIETCQPRPKSQSQQAMTPAARLTALVRQWEINEKTLRSLQQANLLNVAELGELREMIGTCFARSQLLEKEKEGLLSEIQTLRRLDLDRSKELEQAKSQLGRAEADRLRLKEGQQQLRLGLRQKETELIAQCNVLKEECRAAVKQLEQRLGRALTSGEESRRNEASLAQHVESLRLDLRKAESERVEQVNQQGEKLHHLEFQCKTLRDCLEEQRNAAEAQQRELSRARAQVQALEEELQGRGRETLGLEEQLKRRVSQLEHLRANKKHLEKSFIETQWKVAESQRQSQSIKQLAELKSEEVQELKRQIEREAREIEELRREREKLARESQERRAAVERSQAEFLSLRTGAREQLESLNTMSKAKEKELQGQIWNLKAQLAQTVSKAESARQCLAEEKQSLVADHSARVKLLEQTMQRKENQMALALRVKQAELQGLVQEQAKLKADLGRLQRQLYGQRMVAQGLQQKLQAAKLVQERIRAELSEEQRARGLEREKLRRELVAVGSKANEAEEGFKRQAEDSRAKVVELQHRNAALQQNLQLVNRKLKEIKDCEKHLRDQLDQAKELRADLESKHREALVQQADELQRQLTETAKEAEAQIGKLKGQLQSKHFEVRQLRQSVEELAKSAENEKQVSLMRIDKELLPRIVQLTELNSRLRRRVAELQENELTLHSCVNQQKVKLSESEARLSCKVNQLVQAAKEQAEAINRGESLLSQARQEAERQAKKASGLQKKVAYLQESIEAISIRNDELVQQLESSTEQNQSLTAELQSASQQVDTLKGECAFRCKVSVQLERKVSLLVQQAEESARELLGKSKLLDQLAEVNRLVRGQVQQQSRAFEDKFQLLQTQSAQLQRQLLIEREKGKEALKLSENWQLDSLKLSVIQTELQEAVQARNNQLQELESEAGRLRVEKDELEQIVERQRVRLLTLTTQLDSHEHDSERDSVSQQATLSKLKFENEELTARLQYTEMKLLSFTRPSQTKADQQQKEQLIQRELAGLKQTIRELNQQLLASSGQRLQLKEELLKVQKEKQRARKKLASVSEEKEQDVARLRRQLCELREEREVMVRDKVQLGAIYSEQIGKRNELLSERLLQDSGLRLSMLGASLRGSKFIKRE